MTTQTPTTALVEQTYLKTLAMGAVSRGDYGQAEEYILLASESRRQAHITRLIETGKEQVARDRYGNATVEALKASEENRHEPRP